MKSISVSMILLAAALSSNLSRADGVAGHGGDGLKIGTKVYPLDLVEAGVETNPYFDTSAVSDPAVKASIERALDPTLFPTLLISQKLTEIRAVDLVLSQAIEATIIGFNWNLVSRTLVDIKDEEQTDIQFDLKDLVQLAIRRNRSILIDRGYWQQMDVKSRVALVFHEAVYAALTPTQDKIVLNPNYPAGELQVAVFQQSSKKARELTGYLFTVDLPRKGAEGLRAVNYSTIWSSNRYATGDWSVVFENARGIGLPVSISRSNLSIKMTTPSVLGVYGCPHGQPCASTYAYVETRLNISGRTNPSWRSLISTWCSNPNNWWKSSDLHIGALDTTLTQQVMDYVDALGSTKALRIDYSESDNGVERVIGPFSSSEECTDAIFAKANEIAARLFNP